MNELTTTYPWDKEEVPVRWQYRGWDCHVLRQRSLGHLCGYVRLPETHILHGVGYDSEVPAKLQMAMEEVLKGPIGSRSVLDTFFLAMGGKPRAGMLIDVHGSVTFAGQRDDGFWWGFDCGHAGDFSPETYRRYGWGEGEVYRDLPFVRAQCESMVNQLIQLQEWSER